VCESDGVVITEALLPGDRLLPEADRLDDRRDALLAEAEKDADFDREPDGVAEMEALTARVGEMVHVCQLITRDSVTGTLRWSQWSTGRRRCTFAGC
jgi:hypothetical protein